MQKKVLENYKDSYKNAAYVDRVEMSPPKAISQSLDEEFEYIKYATPINKKTMEQVIPQEGLFERILFSVHSNKHDLEVLKGVNRLLDKNSIIDLCLPFESIGIMGMYYFVVERPPYIDELFDIYEDSSAQNFGSLLLPFTVGYPKGTSF